MCILCVHVSVRYNMTWLKILHHCINYTLTLASYYMHFMSNHNVLQVVWSHMSVACVENILNQLLYLR